MHQPGEILTSGPVALRRWRAADAPAVYQVVMQSLEHLRPWMPWANRYSRDDAVRFTTQSEQDWDAGVAYQYAITTEDAVVGSCGLMRRIGPGGLEIGLSRLSKVGPCLTEVGREWPSVSLNLHSGVADPMAVSLKLAPDVRLSH